MLVLVASSRETSSLPVYSFVLVLQRLVSYTVHGTMWEQDSLFKVETKCVTRFLHRFFSPPNIWASGVGDGVPDLPGAAG